MSDDTTLPSQPVRSSNSSAGDQDYHTRLPQNAVPSRKSTKDLWGTVKRQVLKKNHLQSIALQVRARSLLTPIPNRVAVSQSQQVELSHQQNEPQDLETQSTPLLYIHTQKQKNQSKIKDSSSTFLYGSSSSYPYYAKDQDKAKLFTTTHQVRSTNIFAILSTIRALVWNDATIPFYILNCILLLIASIFFHALKNPVWSILPTDATVSWWILFVLRLNLTRCCSLCTQYWTLQALYIDDFKQRQTRKNKRTLVSDFDSSRSWILWIKFIVKQSQGWPFICILWGFWTFLLMYGSRPFAKHWLFFTHWPMFSMEQNSDHGILESRSYRGVLISVILTGVATSIKRMYFAVYLGKRMYSHFHPHVKALTENMQLIAELADFSNEDLSDFHMVEVAVKDSSEQRKVTSANVMDDVSDEDSVVEEEDSQTLSFQPLVNPIDIHPNIIPPDPMDFVQSDSESSTDVLQGKIYPTSSSRSIGFSLKHHNASGFHDVKNKLDRWKEPSTDMNEPSFQEIFLLREALSTMDDPHPFTASFGLADTRDHCIKSAMHVYKNLLRFTPSEFDLPFETIAVLSYELNEGGSYVLNENKLRLLRSHFRPDKQNHLSMIAFIQSADLAYKKLIYLRASMANSIRIDLVLESIVNPLFYIGLLFAVLTILEYDTRTLLVTVSTVVLSVAFAIGSSISKYVEGIFFIAVRRPFDIGDRISIVGAHEAVIDTWTIDTWIVEDIDLMTTTLRLSSTNEVSTVDNYAIASSRIINHNRSSNPLVSIQIQFLLNTTQDQLDAFLDRVRQYTQERQRTWHHVVNFRQNRFDLQGGWIEYTVRAQHIKSWQDKSLIQTDKAELLKFCQDEANRMGILHLSCPVRSGT